MRWSSCPLPSKDGTRKRCHHRLVVVLLVAHSCFLLLWALARFLRHLLRCLDVHQSVFFHSWKFSLRLNLSCRGPRQSRAFGLWQPFLAHSVQCPSPELACGIPLETGPG